MAKLKLTTSPGVFVYFCPGCEQVHAVWTDPANKNPINDCIWKFNNNFEEPTIQPSLNIINQCHCVITNGTIYFCPDSKHELAGQTVPMSDIEEHWGSEQERVKTERYTTQFCHYMPAVKEPGILYVSYHFQLAIHLCACGCGGQAVTKLAVNGRKKAQNVWDYTYYNDDGSSSLYASILNRWCEAHYYIERGFVRWC